MVHDASAGARMVTPAQAPGLIKAQAPRPAAASQSVERERWTGRKAIIFDRAAGKLRVPTPRETADLVSTLRQLTSRPASKPSVAANGAVKVEIDGGVPNIVIARATADGQMETRCVQTFEEAIDFLGLVSLGDASDEE